MAQDCWNYAGHSTSEEQWSDNQIWDWFYNEGFLLLLLKLDLKSHKILIQAQNKLSFDPLILQYKFRCSTKSIPTETMQ